MASGVTLKEGYYGCLPSDGEETDGESDGSMKEEEGRASLSPPGSGSTDPISTQTSRLLLSNPQWDTLSDYTATASTVTQMSGKSLFWRTFQNPNAVVYEPAWEKMVSAHRSGIWRIVPFSSSGVVSCSYDKTAKVWDMMRGICQKTINHPAEVLCAAAREGEAVTACSQGHLYLWDLPSWNRKGELRDPNRQGVYSVEFLMGNRIATGTVQKPEGLPPNHKWIHAIKIWSLSQKQVIGRCQGHTGGVCQLICLPDNRLLSTSQDGTVRVWHTLQATQEGVSQPKKRGRIYSMCLLGNTVITGGQASVLEGWDIGSLEASGDYTDQTTQGKTAHESTIFDVCQISEQTFASASRDGSIKVWDLRQSGPVLRLNPDDGYVYSVSSLSEQCLIAGTGGRKSSSKTREPNLVSWVFPTGGDLSQKVETAE